MITTGRLGADKDKSMRGAIGPPQRKESVFGTCRRKQAARRKAAAARPVDGKAKNQDSRHDTMTGDAPKLAKAL